MILRYLVDPYWVHQVSSACPTTPENDMGQSNSGTEMSIYTSIVQAETNAGLQMDKHQFQLGLLKYILTSLFHYHSVPCHFQEWLDKRSSPDVPSIDQPGSISRSCPPSNAYDSPDGGNPKCGRKRKCACLSSNCYCY